MARAACSFHVSKAGSRSRTLSGSEAGTRKKLGTCIPKRKVASTHEPLLVSSKAASVAELMNAPKPAKGSPEQAGDKPIKAVFNAQCEDTKPVSFESGDFWASIQKGQSQEARTKPDTITESSWPLGVLVPVVVGGAIVSAAVAPPALSAPLPALETYFPPLNAATSPALREVVYLAFAGTVAMNVVVPQWLFVGALVSRNEPLIRANLSYWQAASLLLITVYLAICESPLCYLTALGANVTVPLSLWWWEDISERVEATAAAGGRLEQAWLTWRTAATGVAVFTAGAQLATNRACSGLGSAEALLADPRCAAWLEPPHYYNTLLHPTLPTASVLPLAAALLALYGVRWTLVLLEAASRGRKSYTSDNVYTFYPSSTTFLARLVGFLPPAE